MKIIRTRTFKLIFNAIRYENTIYILFTWGDVCFQDGGQRSLPSSCCNFWKMPRAMLTTGDWTWNVSLSIIYKSIMRPAYVGEHIERTVVLIVSIFILLVFLFLLYIFLYVYFFFIFSKKKNIYIFIVFIFWYYTYRYGFFAAYMSSPSHIEVILTEKEDIVSKATEEEPSKKKLSKKKLARQKEKMMRE